MAEPAPGISATPHEDNLRYFDVIMAGPSQSPFEGTLTFVALINSNIFDYDCNYPIIFSI